MNRTDDTLLRTLDAAPAAMTAAERERSGVLLERIVAEAAGPTPGRDTAGLTQARQARRSWHPRRRLLLVPLAVAALAVPLVLAPDPVPGLDRAAYASWTPAPTAVDGRSLHAATSACRDETGKEEWTNETDGGFDPRDARQVLAERRGEFVAVVLWSPSAKVTIRCLVHDPSGTGSVGSIDVSTVSDGGWGPLAPRTFRPGGYTDGTGSGIDVPSTSWWMSSVDRIAGFVLNGGRQVPPPFRGSVVDGFVGEGVSGVTVHAGEYTVEATVAGGRLVAWWPGPAADCYPQDTGVLRCDPIMTYDLHLADGTTVVDAQPQWEE